MNAYVGIIVAGDRTEKTITIQCPKGVSGVEIGKEVIITPVVIDDKKEIPEMPGILEPEQEFDTLI
jgi:hypothetical protein